MIKNALRFSIGLISFLALTLCMLIAIAQMMGYDIWLEEAVQILAKI